MKICELTVHGKERYDYSDVGYSLSIRGRGKPDAEVKTSVPGITLEIHDYGNKYVTIIKDQGKKVGFIDFVEPNQVYDSRFNFNSHTRTPHSGIRETHTGRGYISTIYRWFLDAGHNLVTGHEQTESSNAMWRSLARSYPIVFFDNMTGREIKNPTPKVAMHKFTRMALLGKGNHSLKDLFQ